VSARAALGLLLAGWALAGCGGGTTTRTDAAATAPRAAPTAPAPRAVRGPLLVAAGDIACAPGEPRTRFACHQLDIQRVDSP